MLTDLSKLIMRKLRLVKINRNFLVFLVFLAVSISFWFMQSIKETTEVNIAYKLRIVELPKNVISHQTSHKTSQSPTPARGGTHSTTSS